jgi:hypothetical protein
MSNEDLLESSLTVKQFNALFNSDIYTMRMLQSINNEIKQDESRDGASKVKNFSP